MSITKIYEQIDNALEDGLSVSFLCNTQLADIISDYLQDTYDMQGTSSKTRKGNIILFEENLVMINFNEYDFSVDNARYSNGLIKALKTDIFIAIGDYNNYDVAPIESEIRVIYKKFDIKEEEIHWNQIVDEENDEYYDCLIEECGCPDCCVECNDTECEYQGDSEDCECDNCSKDYETKEVEMIAEFVETILKSENCPACIFNLLLEFAKTMKTIGWIDCINYLESKIEE